MMNNKIKITIVLLLLALFAGLGFTYRPVDLDDMERVFLSYINEARMQNNLAALLPSQLLTDVARLRCNDMVSRGYFSHYMPEGRRVKYGEVLGRASPASLGTAENFLEAWLNSQSHNEVILNPAYRKVGIDIVDSDDTKIVTIIFSRY